jgi:alpha-glucosidase (family GH31 glycosyl hydrolase)
MTTDNGKPGLAPWWHDPAAPVDLSNPKAYAWLKGKYQFLVDTYGVDGFKLDTGDGRYRRDEFQTFAPMTQTEYTDAFLALGADFEYNEYKVGWSAQQLGIVQRLRDKAPEWTGYEGMDLIVSHGVTLSLLGYPYWSPDMIGGGWNTPFQDPEWEGMDEELFIRWTQASTFMPMMQFSYGPWNLSQETVAICRQYMELHQQLGAYLYALAQDAQQTGMPMTQPLFFADPRDPICYQRPNQFLLGERFMIAPVLAKGQTALDVYLPAGTWKDFWSEALYPGKTWLRDYAAPLEKLPIFIRVE